MSCSHFSTHKKSSMSNTDNKLDKNTELCIFRSLVTLAIHESVTWKRETRRTLSKKEIGETEKLVPRLNWWSIISHKTQKDFGQKMKSAKLEVCLDQKSLWEHWLWIEIRKFLEKKTCQNFKANNRLWMEV